MTMLALVAAALIALTAAAALLPLLFTRATADAAAATDVNAGIFLDRLAELDAERAAGRLDAGRYAALRLDLERTLLADAGRAAAGVHDDATGAAPAAGAGGALPRWPFAALALTLPLAAGGYYYWRGYSAGADDWLAVQQRMGPLVEQALAAPDRPLPDAAQDALPDFVRTLAARVLRDHSDDPERLYLLGAQLLDLQAADAAVEVLGRAEQLAPQRVPVLLAYAQARMQRNQGRLDAASADLIRRALALQPGHRGALMMLGFGAYNGGDYAVALSAWRPLLDAVEPGSEPARLLANSIAAAERLLAESQQTPAAATEAAADSGTDGPHIAVTVDLSPALRGRLPPGATLFIFARAADGPPMPLAAVRQPADASRFPVEVTLDDSLAMLPSLKLSDFQNVLVGARISRSGDVAARTGDLEAANAALTLASGAQSVTLTVDRVVQ